MRSGSTRRTKSSGGIRSEMAVSDHLTRPWQLSLSFGEAMNEELLHQAWDEVFQRHDGLRASFHLKSHRPGGGIMIEEKVRPLWQSLNWQSLSPDEVAIQWQHFQREDDAKTFALDTAPLSRITFLTLPGGSSHILWSFPGILLDEASVWRVVEDVLLIYETLSRREVLQDIACASWMDYLSNREAATTDFQEFRGAHEITPLPFENVEPTGSQFACTSLEMNRQLGKACSDLSRDLHIAVEQFARAAWALTLGRLNAEDDVLFWESRSERSESDTPVGRASKLVLNHVQLDPGACVQDWLRSYPLPFIASPSTRGIRTVLEVHRFNGAGVLADRMPRWIKIDAILKRPVQGSPTLICRLGDRPSVELLFDAAWLSEDRAKATLKYFNQALTELIAKPQHLLCQLEVVPPEEVERILAASVGPIQPSWLSLYPDALFRESSLLQAGRMAVESPSGTLSYDELHTHVARFSNYLTNQKFSSNSLIAIALTPSPWLPIAILGIWTSGGAILPVHKLNTAGIQGSRYKRHSLCAILTDSSAKADFPLETKTPLFIIDELFNEMEVVLDLEPSTKWDGKSRAWFRTGENESTRSSSAEYSGGAFCNLAVEIVSEITLEIHDRVYLGSPPLEASMTIAMLATFIAGASLIFGTPQSSLASIENLSDECERHQISILMISSEDFQKWASHLKRPGAMKPPASLRRIAVFGDTCSTSALATWQSMGLQDLAITVFWSPSDWVLPSIVRTWPDSSLSHSHIGKPISNALACVMDSSHLIPEGIPGYLVMGGFGIPEIFTSLPNHSDFESDPFRSDSKKSILRTDLQVIRKPDGLHTVEEESIDSIEESESAPIDATLSESGENDSMAKSADSGSFYDEGQSNPLSSVEEEEIKNRLLSPSKPSTKPTSFWYRWLNKLSGK